MLTRSRTPQPDATLCALVHACADTATKKKARSSGMKQQKALAKARSDQRKLASTNFLQSDALMAFLRGDEVRPTLTSLLLLSPRSAPFLHPPSPNRVVPFR